MVNNLHRTIQWLSNELSFVRCACCQLLPQQSSAGLCEICEESLDKHRLSKTKCCGSCALPIDPPAQDVDQKPSVNRLLCGQCLSQTPEFDRCIAAVRYTSLTGKLVNQLKHQGRLSPLPVMSQQLLDALEPHDTGSVDLLIPVPLHRKRLFERGFNQSLELCKMLSRELRIPFARNLCIRPAASVAQQTLSKKNRHRNLKDAFAFKRRVEGLRLAIVDDVATTTATAQSIAKTAKAAGASKVDLWCYARTPAPD